MPDIVSAIAAPRVLDASMRPAKRRISLHDLLTHTAGFVHRLWNSDPAASRVTIGVGTQPIRGARAGVHEHGSLTSFRRLKPRA